MMRVFVSFAALLVWLAALPAGAQTMFHRAENQVPVAVVQVVRATAYTEVHLRTLEPLKGVCWYMQGADSPYLLAGGTRYRLLRGGNITACPARRDYASGETMTLSFQPIDPQVRIVSLVEGQAGENQMIDPTSRPNEQFWNFLRFTVN